MKIIYEAFDGTQFDNEFECEDYEWKLNHEKSLKGKSRESAPSFIGQEPR